VLFSRYPYTWEGGTRASASPGGSSINSGEARDLLLAVASARSRAPPATTRTAKTRRADARARHAAGNGVCTGCHAKYAATEALAAHSHHLPSGAGAACVGCHLPRKNTGLGYALTRYHRIGSPTDPARVLGDRPLECAICHGDKSVEWIVDRMEQLWDKALRPRGGAGALPDLAGNALAQTVTNGKPHEQLAAIALLGERGDASVAPLVSAQLDHHYGLVGLYAQQALAKLKPESAGPPPSPGHSASAP